MALLPSIQFEKTEDGSRYKRHTYDIIFERKWHLFKGRKIVYIIEMDGQKRLLRNGGRVGIPSNLTHMDIQITKMSKDVELSSARLCGLADEWGHSFITLDVTPDAKPVFKILKYTHDEELQLIED